MPCRRGIIVRNGTQAKLALEKYETSLVAPTHVRHSNIKVGANWSASDESEYVY
jgi:hypothetical protein